VHARLHAQQPARCAAGRAARPSRAALALPGTPPAHALCVDGVSVGRAPDDSLRHRMARRSVCKRWPVLSSPLGLGSGEGAWQLPCFMGDMLRVHGQRPAASGTSSLITLTLPYAAQWWRRRRAWWWGG